MGRCGIVVAAVLLLAGCGAADSPEARPAVPHPTAVSPAELLEKYQQASAAYDAGEIPAFLGITDELVEAWLGGIDGLTLVGPRELIAVQSGITPNRVVRIRLCETFVGVASVEVLDLAHPEQSLWRNSQQSGEVRKPSPTKSLSTLR